MVFYVVSVIILVANLVIVWKARPNSKLWFDKLRIVATIFLIAVVVTLLVIEYSVNRNALLHFQNVQIGFSAAVKDRISQLFQALKYVFSFVKLW
jgi:uncharacterized membrane protein YbhN (UPF0104 family)